MKTLNIVKRSLLSLAILPVLLISGSATAAAAQIPYVPGEALPAPTTPAFNIYTNIPYGYGDESDFVRVRPSTGNPTFNGENGNRNSLYVDALNADCKVGDMFDVRTYVHNGADEEMNDNGNGSAVAHGVTLNLTAPIGSKGKQFVFASMVSANNAATVNDKGTLNCASDVVLEFVPNTVNVYSKSYGWKPASDSSINGSLSLGSEVFGSGDVWGCWDKIILTTYTVKVVAVPETPKAPEAPKELPRTGAGNVAAIFATTSIAGAFLYRLRALRSEV